MKSKDFATAINMRHRMSDRETCRMLLWAACFMLLASCFIACSNDDDVQDISSDKLQLVAFTRAGESSPFEAKEVYSPIKLFLWNGNDSKVGNARYNGTEWKISGFVDDDVTTSYQYSLYGFGPSDAVGSSLTIGAETTTLTLTSLPAVNKEDVCFVVGIQRTTNPAEKNIRQGNFSFTAGDTNPIYLLMDHVYASVCFSMAIDADYAKLRSIKIKKMELHGTKNTAIATITLKPNTTNTDPVQSVTYTTTGSSRSTMFFESAEGDELTSFTAAKAKEYICCFLPELGNDLTLVTTYDIYNKKGNKISERSVANKLPNLSATRGQRVTMTLTVAPTYLGVLSDPDLDDPAISITN